MSYVAQLLPDLRQARILRTALMAYVDRDDITEEDRDLAYEMLVKLTADMRREARGMRS